MTRRKSAWLRDAVITLLILIGLAALVVTQSRSRPSTERPPRPPVAGNAYPLLETLINPSTDLDTRLSLLPDAMQYAELQIPDGATPLPSYSYFPFFETGVLAKLASVESLFLLLEGQRTEALELLASVFYLGSLLAADFKADAGVAGSRMMLIAGNALALQVLNTGESAADRRMAWDILEDLDARTLPPNRAAYKGTMGAFQFAFPGKHLRHSFTRLQVAYVRFQLLRCALAALHAREESGRWPVSGSDFAPLFPSGLPDDPFDKGGEPYRFAATPSGDFIVWSVGPDGTDDSGALAYQPSLDPYSPGDLILEVAQDRKYPFPTSGTAVVADEISTRFPHGLPPDPFFPSVRLSLSSTPPGMVYSFGPDTHSDNTGAPEIQYDPTNGIISIGDLIRVLRH